MKKIMITIILFSAIFFNTSVINAQLNIDLNSKSGVMIEASTKKILYEKEAHEKMSPASMTKMMTLLLVMEAIDDGRLSLDKEIIVSENAVSMGGSQVYLETNAKFTVKELLKAVCISSANDASVALAEAVGGTVENFVAMMNKKVSDLGLKNTNFKNPHGLDEANHYSSSYDMAIIASELVKHEEILEFSSTYEDNFIHPNGKSIWLVNTNSLLRYYDGVDGLKTGYTDTAGYCLTATKEVNNMRIITVTMNSETKEERNKDAVNMMEYAFSNYNIKVLLDKNKSLGKIFVDKSENKYVDYYLKNDIKLLLTNDIRDLEYDYEINVNENLTAPINNGETIGKIEIKYNGQVLKYDLIVNEDIKKSSYFLLMWNYLKDIVSGNINFIKN